MSFPTSVNSLITDADTQVNVKVLGEAPAVAMAKVCQAAGQSLSYAMQNAISAQNNMAISSEAATTTCVAIILGADLSEPQNSQGGGA